MTHKKSLVILTGAGISAESGVKTFRDHEGLWEGHRIEEVATPQAFAVNPGLVHNFYNKRRQQLKEVNPNLAHLALAELEDKLQSSFLLITQNVDDLHERAGSKNVLHMHGELKSVFCQLCNVKQSWSDDLGEDTICPSCHREKALRPDIVWFGEVPYHMETISKALSACDIFIAIGTSGLVYPAAGFVQLARKAFKIEVNLKESAITSLFDKQYLGAASQEVPKLAKDLLIQLNSKM